MCFRSTCIGTQRNWDFVTERSLNFKPAFLTALSEALGLPQVAPFNLPEGVSPEEILAYIYAILYSPNLSRTVL